MIFGQDNTNVRFFAVGKFAASIERLKTTSASASGGGQVTPLIS